MAILFHLPKNEAIIAVLMNAIFTRMQ